MNVPPTTAQTEAAINNAIETAKALLPRAQAVAAAGAKLSSEPVHGILIASAAVRSVVNRLRADGVATDAIVIAMIETLDGVYFDRDQETRTRALARSMYAANPVLIDMWDDGEDLEINTAYQLLSEAAVQA